MNLESYQNGLLHLVTRNAVTVEDAPYLQSLVDSERLGVVREVICYWRAYGLERFSVLVAPYLQSQGCFDAVVQRFVGSGTFSASLAESGKRFLDWLVTDGDPIVASLARTELALHRTQSDRTAVVDVEWPCDPEPLLLALLAREDLASRALTTRQRHRLRVSRSYPLGYLSERVP
jgi:hypothetical protein